MGVAPSCDDEQFRSAKMAYQNPYEQILMALEDEKYNIDSNLLKKKKLLQVLEEIQKTADENEQYEQLEKLMKTNVK